MLLSAPQILFRLDASCSSRTTDLVSTHFIPVVLLSFHYSPFIIHHYVSRYIPIYHLPVSPFPLAFRFHQECIVAQPLPPLFRPPWSTFASPPFLPRREFTATSRVTRRPPAKQPSTRAKIATATSFRNCSNVRPSRYRTPSPPRQAVEPISPRASSDLHPFWSTHYDDNAAKRHIYDQEHIPVINGFDGFQDRSGYQQCSATDIGVPSKIGGHSRSGSTIDTLATIALATSPAFAPIPYGNAVNRADSAAASI